VQRIFMAEDNPGDVYLMNLALRESGAIFELEVASTGKEALEFLDREKKTDEPTLALILLDLNLPHYDGTEILQHVRQNPRLTTVPIVFFTSSDSPKDRANAISEGASHFIRKPSALHEYLAIGSTLKGLLESKTRTNSAS